MSTNTVVKAVRLHPFWEVRIEKLLHQNLEERDKSEFIAAAVTLHITDWLLRQPQFPTSLLELPYHVASVTVTERDLKRQTDIYRTFSRLQSVIDRLKDDQELVTTLVTTVKSLIDIAPDNEPLDKLFRISLSSYPQDEALREALSGVSLRPGDAVETAEPKPPRTRTDGINPDDFSQSFQDSHGHSQSVSFRVSSALDFAIDRIIESQVFLYNTASDLIRHAVARRIVSLETRPRPQSVESQATAISRVLREWEIRLEADVSFFAALRETVENYTKAKDADGVYAACIAAKVSLEIMPDSLWKERKRRLFEAEFGHLLAGRGIDLNPNHS